MTYYVYVPTSYKNVITMYCKYVIQNKKTKEKKKRHLAPVGLAWEVDAGPVSRACQSCSVY